MKQIEKRIKGEFFTEKIFVDQAHNYISKCFGEDWKEKYVVLDCCCGTNNLTKDYNFSNLYLSTLEQEDIDNINVEATVFQYDFLNDNYDKLPKSLKDHIESGKDIIFFINPPYFKANPMKGIDGTDVCTTIIGEEMRLKKYGQSSSQLSTQFLYRILKLKKINPNIKIGVFNVPNYMTSSGFKTFRKSFLNEFGFVSGFLINAGTFENVSKKWGISFTIWGSNPINEKNNFEHDVIEHNKKIKKTIYNCDNLIRGSDFFKQTREIGNILLPAMKSFITINKNFQNVEAASENCIAFMNNHSNNLYERQLVYICSSIISTSACQQITPKNIEKALALFTARKCVMPNWINNKDEYLAPNEQHEEWKQFTIDSIVYSLFNNSSQQSGMRQVEYKDKLWDIKNEFFWLSREQMMDLSLTNNIELYNDADNSNNRFIYNKLFGEERLYDKLSPDAKDVLDTATELLIKSIDKRNIISQQHPEYHLNSFDAGYAQLKLVWKEEFLGEFKEFRKKYKFFEQRLKNIVYTLGYLK